MTTRILGSYLTRILATPVTCSLLLRNPMCQILSRVNLYSSVGIVLSRNYAQDAGSVEKQADEKHGSPVPEVSQEVSVTAESVLPDKLYKTIELELLAYEPEALNSYEWFLLTAASHLGIEVGKVYTPRTSDKFRFPLLKSAHVHKKHKVFYEIRTHHKFITLKKLTGSTASTYLEYIQRNIPEGIGMKVSKLEVLPKPSYVTEGSIPLVK